jgi:hypothetical protein
MSAFYLLLSLPSASWNSSVKTRISRKKKQRLQHRSGKDEWKDEENRKANLREVKNWEEI